MHACDAVYICVQMCILFATKINVNVIYMKKQQLIRSNNLGRAQ